MNYNEDGKVLCPIQTKSMSTSYQADTDGIVVAEYRANGGDIDLYIYSDSNASPTTEVAHAEDSTPGSEEYTTLHASYPVKSGDYWKATGSGSTLTESKKVTWIPLS